MTGAVGTVLCVVEEVAEWLWFSTEFACVADWFLTECACAVSVSVLMDEWLLTE